MNSKSAIASFVCCLMTMIALAQGDIPFEKSYFPERKSELKEAYKSLKEGDAYFEKGRFGYKMAIPHFLKAQAFNPDNALLNLHLGMCYLFSSNRVASIPYLEKAYKLNPEIDPRIHYYLGWAYQLNLAFDDAITEFRKYQSQLSSDEPDLLKLVVKHVEECEVGKQLVQEPVRAFIDNVGPTINKATPEYGPVISADESVMYFTSRREGTTGGGMDENLFEPFEDVYVSYNRGGDWSDPVNLGSPVNSDDHDANVGLSPDGQWLLIYKDENDGDLFECELKGEEWSKPQRLPKTINTDYHESSASISYDGRKIYFVSDRPDSRGGRDIFVSTRDSKGRWGEAKNLGPTINTPYDEEAVFMHPDGKTMYFSSKGHKTMGGYDIFKTVFENGSWSEPENMGYPINTPDDDVFFVVSANGRHGYYASFRTDGYGEKDIYKVTMLGPEKPLLLSTEDYMIASVAKPVSEKAIEPSVPVSQASITLLKGVVTDAVTKAILEAAIEIVDNETGEVIAGFLSNSKTGKYLVTLPSGKNYGIAVKKEGYLFHSENFDVTALAAYQEVVKDIALKNVAVGSKIVLKNIFFDTDKAVLRHESFAEIDRLMKLLNDVPDLKIEISGHTDNTGSATHNQTLSEERAQSVVQYLISKGISSQRLVFKGYGKDQPIAGNDSEEGRQMNRRTEFKILEK
ncbi:MAG: PD40 domain-containing protein [Flavobacteriales bacterium]|nr:PD40 domain-containing protein [Flavobacteriales bacterium]